MPNGDSASSGSPRSTATPSDGLPRDRRDSMKRSTERILTTHVGSLVRPDALLEYLRAKRDGGAYDAAGHGGVLSASVHEVGARQRRAGIDIVNDGEFGKTISWSQYALERLSGFERRPVAPGADPFARGADRARFADFYRELDAREAYATT